MTETTQSPTGLFDFYIYSDGSGHYSDRVGGYGAIICSPVHDECKHIASFGCGTHMETGRAEFMAVMSALHAILELKGWERKSARSVLSSNKPTVLITSDRLDLVGSINKEFRRESNADLWAQFEWYEQYLDIKATHVKRDTQPTQRVADILASELRIVLLEYTQTKKELNQI